MSVLEGWLGPLAVFSAKRSPFLPDVPTLAELGYPNIDLVSWGTVVVPKGVPPAIRERLFKVLEEVIASMLDRDPRDPLSAILHAGGTPVRETYRYPPRTYLATLRIAAGSTGTPRTWRCVR